MLVFRQMLAFRRSIPIVHIDAESFQSRFMGVEITFLRL